MLAGMDLLPGLQLGRRGRSRGGRVRGGRSRGCISRGKGSSRGSSSTRVSRGSRRRMGGNRGGRLQEEEEPSAQSELQYHTTLLADPGTGQEGRVASLLALQALEVIKS